MEEMVVTRVSPAPRVVASMPTRTPLSPCAVSAMVPLRADVKSPRIVSAVSSSGPARTLSASNESLPLGAPRTNAPVAVRSATPEASVLLSTSRPESVVATAMESNQPLTRPRSTMVPLSESGVSPDALLSHGRRPPSESTVTRNSNESLRPARSPRPPRAPMVTDGDTSDNESRLAMPSRKRTRANPSVMRNASTRERPSIRENMPSSVGSESPRMSTSARPLSCVTDAVDRASSVRMSMRSKAACPFSAYDVGSMSMTPLPEIAPASPASCAVTSSAAMVPFTVIGPDIVPRNGIITYELPSMVKDSGSAFSCMS